MAKDYFTKMSPQERFDKAIEAYYDLDDKWINEIMSIMDRDNHIPTIGDPGNVIINDQLAHEAALKDRLLSENAGDYKAALDAFFIEVGQEVKNQIIDFINSVEEYAKELSESDKKLESFEQRFSYDPAAARRLMKFVGMLPEDDRSKNADVIQFPQPGEY